MSRSLRATPRAVLALILVVCAVALALGFALKAQCLAGFDGRQYERLCYNDIQPLYGVREIDAGTFPYVHGSLRGGVPTGGAIEYPVVTGLFMWLTGRLAGDADAYLAVSAAFLAPFAVLVAYLLFRMAGARALMWAGAPALVLYAFHNWDLLVVAAAVVGLFLWARGRDVGTAIAFGLGGALKLYPLFFLVPVVLDKWRSGDRSKARRVLGWGVGAFVAVNLPFVVASPSGWWATYAFHRARGPNFDTFWQFGFPGLAAHPETLNVVSGGLTLAFFIAALAIAWRRAPALGGYPVVAVCGALVAAFLAWNKIHSPQYTLWLLPFFVLLGVSIRWWAAYAIVDLMVYVGVFRWFFEIVYRGASVDAFSGAKVLLIAGVWLRLGLLLALFAVFLSVRAVTHVTSFVAPAR